MRYSTLLLSQILKLSDEDLLNLNMLMFDIRESFKEEKFDIYKFYKAYRIYTLKKVTSYCSFVIKRYLSLIEKLESLNLINIISYVAIPAKYNSFSNLLSHIIEQYENINDIRKNIDELLRLGIEEFDFCAPKRGIINKKVYENGNSESPCYMLSSFYTDGERSWKKEPIFEQPDDECNWGEREKIYDNVYIVKVQSPGYILNYVKNKDRGLENFALTIYKLNFDRSTLPTYDELYSENVWQKLNVLFIASENLQTKFMKIEKELTSLSNAKSYKDALCSSKKLSLIVNELISVMADSHVMLEEEARKTIC